MFLIFSIACSKPKKEVDLFFHINYFLRPNLSGAVYAISDFCKTRGVRQLGGKFFRPSSYVFENPQDVALTLALALALVLVLGPSSSCCWIYTCNVINILLAHQPPAIPIVGAMPSPEYARASGRRHLWILCRSKVQRFGSRQILGTLHSSRWQVLASRQETLRRWKRGKMREYNARWYFWASAAITLVTVPEWYVSSDHTDWTDPFLDVFFNNT